MPDLTVPQAAAALNLSVDGVHHLIKVGTLRAAKIGRDYLIRAADVERTKVRRGRGRPRLKPAP
jgi:excisionase family DNA binding protein